MDVFTLREMLSSANTPDSDLAEKKLQIGLMALMLRREIAVVPTDTWINLAVTGIDSGRAEFFFDKVGRLIGHVVWDRFNSLNSVEHIKFSYPAIVHIPADTGDEVLITDFSGTLGAARRILPIMRDKVFKSEQTVTYARFKHGQMILKQVSRADLTSFMTAPCLLDDRQTSACLEENLRSKKSTFARAEALGACLLAARYSHLLRAWPIGRTVSFLRGLMSMRQIKVYESATREPGGLLTWAWLSDYSVRNLLVMPLYRRHLSEWNEGTFLCFFTGGCSPSQISALRQDVLTKLFPEQNEILLHIHNRNKTVAVNRSCCLTNVIDKWIAHDEQSY